MNDQEIGRTPVTTDFTFYGDYDVRLSHEDSLPLWTHRTVRTPYWDLPGIDLVAEAIPGRRTYNVDWHFKLQKRKPTKAPEDSLVQNALEMQQRVQTLIPPSEIILEKKLDEEDRQQQRQEELNSPRPFKSRH